jgi:hypothetical protein
MGIASGDYDPTVYPAVVSATPTVPPGIAQLNWSAATGGVAVQRFIIPLYVFSTLADSMNSLCPAQLLSGARVEILLAAPEGSMISGDSGSGAASTGQLGYLIKSCRFELESYLLTDSVMKALNQISATQGLEVVCATTQNTQAQRTGSQISVDVARSCSKALNVTYKERAPAGANAFANGYAGGNWFDPMGAAILTPDTTASGGYAYVNLPLEWQVRAGQLYFPQASIKSQYLTVAQADNELLMQTLRSYQKFNSGVMGQNASASTNVFKFRGNSILAANQTYGAPGAYGGRAAFSLDLQRSSVLSSGTPLSNSRQLNILYNTTQFFVAAANFNYNVDVFLTYAIQIRTFLSQCVLEV